jgi:hypothetical protein
MNIAATNNISAEFSSAFHIASLIRSWLIARDSAQMENTHFNVDDHPQISLISLVDLSHASNALSCIRRFCLV